MSDTTETKDTLSDAETQEKGTERRLIDREREIYLEKGGTIKKFIPPFQEDNYYLCDVFVPGEGSLQSHSDLKDTMERVPRPPKRFGSKR
jgi:hypothetical protein